MHEQEHLVADIVYDLMGRFKRLPTNDTSLKMIATVEAAAWVIATDGLSEMDRIDARPETIAERNKHYIDVFAAMLDHHSAEVTKD